MVLQGVAIFVWHGGWIVGIQIQCVVPPLLRSKGTSYGRVVGVRSYKSKDDDAEVEETGSFCQNATMAGIAMLWFF